MEFVIITDNYLDSALAKRDELLETLNSYLEKDNQQPSHRGQCGSMEGSTTRKVSPNNNPSHERPAL